MSRPVGERWARLVVRLSSFLVPAERREEWLGEWRGELAALGKAHAGGASGLPSLIGFAAGAVPHALWMTTEGWNMDSFRQDIWYSARVLRRSPVFTLVAALTLALGIGANAATFSLVNGLLLRAPAGVEATDRIVQIARSYESAPRWDSFSWPAMQLIRSEARTLSGVAGFQGRPFILGSGADTERVIGLHVSGDYFGVLGVQPHAGRLIQDRDDVEPGAHHVVVLGYSLWQRRFGGDPGVVGTTLAIGSVPYEIVGVTPRGFTGVESVGTPSALFVPAMQRPSGRGGELFTEWGSSWINVIGRLADGVSFEQAVASMDVVSTRLRQATPIHEDMQVLLAEGLGFDPEGRAEARQLSTILLLIVGIVLLLACTNVANLFLARASARRTEVGVRVALGAGRSRLIRQLGTESLLLAALATVLALPMVMGAGSYLPSVLPMTIATSVGADGKVYLFMIAVGLLTSALFGAGPAWIASRRPALDVLRAGASTGTRSRTRLGDTLVVSQLALSLGLVAGAALLGRSVLNAHTARPGFEPRGLVAASVELGATGRYDQERGRAFFDRLVAAAEATPGVRSATVASQMPIAGGHSRRTVQPVGNDELGFEAEYTIVGARYFETVGIPIVRGRALGGPADEPERVVVVNETLARMFWPGEDAVGKELAGDPGWRVVGVAGDVQMRSLRASANPGVYYPLSQEYSGSMALHVSGETALSRTALAGMVAAVDPELPISAVVDLQGALTDSMGETRAIALLVGAFAVLALLLAAVGLYGLVSHGAAQRVREMGIRLALGAEPGALMRLILVRGIAIAVLGIVVGFGVAYALGQALEGLLFGVSPSDATSLGPAALVLVLAAGVASWVPARRAGRTDAAVSLRVE